jgi:hypothetical protein
MPFTPVYTETLESLVLDNILAIFARDFKAALDYFYPTVAAGVPLLDDSISRPIGTAVLHMDGFTTKPAAGDMFRIAGDTQVYRVVSATNLVGTDSDVTFAPGLQVAIPATDGNQVVTFTGLPDFAQRTLGNFIRLAQPSLAIEPMRGGGDEGEQYESSLLRVNIYLTVDDPDPTEASRKLEKYMRAARAVLKTAPVSDYTAGTTKVFALQPELSWQYNQVAKDANSPNSWLKSVTFDFALKYNER